MAVEKIKILGAVLELPAKQHCQFGPFTKKSGKMGLIGEKLHEKRRRKKNEDHEKSKCEHVVKEE